MELHLIRSITTMIGRRGILQDLSRILNTRDRSGTGEGSTLILRPLETSIDRAFIEVVVGRLK
jgi:hypothetical protein